MMNVSFQGHTGNNKAINVATLVRGGFFLPCHQHIAFPDVDSLRYASGSARCAAAGNVSAPSS